MGAKRTARWAGVLTVGILTALPLGAVPAEADGNAQRCAGRQPTLMGSAARDTLIGTSGPDVIWAGAGKDTINGGGGADLICGGPGKDTVDAGPGSDIVSGGGGDDTIRTGSGQEDEAFGDGGVDTMTAESAGATMAGGPGNDILLGKAEDVGIVGEEGNDRIRADKPGASIDGMTGHDRIVLLASSRSVFGGPGIDTIRGSNDDDGSPEHPVLAGPGNDIIFMNAGTDFVDGGEGDDTIDLGTGEQGWARGGPGVDTMSSAAAGAALYGEAGADVITARGPHMLLAGGEDDDTMTGSRYDDTIDGDEGNDTINAGAGRDVVHAGDGHDRLVVNGGERHEIDAGAGNDTIDYGPAVSGMILAGSGDDVVRSVADGVGIMGEDGHDDILVVGEQSLMDGGAGNDVLTGSPFRDEVVGGDGNDTITLNQGDDTEVEGGAGNDQIDGGAGNDVLAGDGGDDRLVGGDGDDSLFGGDGKDTCLGGAGNDSCNGGPLGTDGLSPDDPDTCGDDVETKRNCRGNPRERWFGRAAGTLTYGGVRETWSTTYTLETVVADYYWAADTAIVWSVGGTDSRGCSYTGQATIPGRAGLTVWDTTSYAHDVHRVAGTTVPVTVSCPGRPLETVPYNPMNTNAAEVDDELIVEPGLEISGNNSYVPTNTTDGLASWSWSLSTTPLQPS